LLSAPFRGESLSHKNLMAVEMGLLWHDPVWSKVIAAIIVALGAALYAWIGQHWFPTIITFNWWFFAIALLGVLGGLVGGFFIFPKLTQSEPNIKATSVRITTAPPDTQLTFPLKCYATLRNDSKDKCADVQLSGYKPYALSISELPLNVLQVRIGGQWHPAPDGASRIAVLPEQTFRAWIGLDHKQYNKEFARELLLKGRIGTLIFKVDGKPVNIDLIAL
jgi:hypothetical protein